MNKPQPQLLTIWRIMLTLAAFVPAFFISLLLRAGSNAWTVSIGAFVFLYLFMYLVYCPMLYKKTRFGISGEKIILTTGVLNTRVIAIPLTQIQFTAVTQYIFGRMFGISSVIVTAPGGRIVIPGIKSPDADTLVLALRPPLDKEGD